MYFSRARKLPFCHFKVFILSAQMEYYVAKEHAIAFKIFELGMKKYTANMAYIHAYMTLLLHHMDDANAKSLFERALQAIPDLQDTLPLWDLLIHYEREYGAFESLQAICERKRKAFSDTTSEWTLLRERTCFPASTLGALGAGHAASAADTAPAPIEEHALTVNALLSKLVPVARYTGPVLSVDVLFAHLSTLALPARDKLVKMLRSGP